MNHMVYLYVFDTMSDWEIGYLTAEMNAGRYYKKGCSPTRIVTVGMDKTPVTTMGGLKVLPDIMLHACSLESMDALILPGGTTWTETMHQPILQFAESCLQQERTVAAICGATIGLAQAGLLNSHWHTSNDLEYLKMICPAYSGETYYKMELAVTDGNLITASGIAPLEFSAHVLNALDVFSATTLDAWYHLNKTQDSKYFYELMHSIQF